MQDSPSTSPRRHSRSSRPSSSAPRASCTATSARSTRSHPSTNRARPTRPMAPRRPCRPPWCPARLRTACSTGVRFRMSSMRPSSTRQRRASSTSCSPTHGPSLFGVAGFRESRPIRSVDLFRYDYFYLSIYLSIYLSMHGSSRLEAGL